MTTVADDPFLVTRDITVDQLRAQLAASRATVGEFAVLGPNMRYGLARQLDGVPRR